MVTITITTNDNDNNKLQFPLMNELVTKHIGTSDIYRVDSPQSIGYGQSAHEFSLRFASIHSLQVTSKSRKEIIDGNKNIASGRLLALRN